MRVNKAVQSSILLLLLCSACASHIQHPQDAYGKCPHGRCIRKQIKPVKLPTVRDWQVGLSEEGIEVGQTSEIAELNSQVENANQALRISAAGYNACAITNEHFAKKLDEALSILTDVIEKESESTVEGSGPAVGAELTPVLGQARRESLQKIDRQKKLVDIVSAGPSVNSLIKKVGPLLGCRLALDFADYRLAVSRCSEGIEQNLKKPEFYNNRGYAHLMMDDNEAAIRDFSQALALTPDSPLILNNRGYAFYIAGDIRRALDDFRRASEIRPDLAVVYSNRGAVLQRIGRHQEAVEDFNRAIDLMPFAAEAYNNRGFSRTALGLLDEAIADYGKAIELRPRYRDAYGNRGYTHILIGTQQALRNAIADLREAIRLDPKWANPHAHLGRALHKLGDSDGAMEEFEAAMKLNPDYPTTYKYRAELLKEMDRDEEAESDLLTYDTLTRRGVGR